ncbi:MAG: LacI family DNA-binding transcriptional regulator [Lachnospiraceae bacterium]
MAVTIKQIAEVSGVSRGTVDRVLNHRGSVNIDTAKKVMEYANLLGYTPNIAGKALAARKKGYVIGVVLNSIGNPFFDVMLEKIEEKKAEYEHYGIKIIVKQMRGYNALEQLRLLEEIEHDISALMITPIDDVCIKNHIDRISEEGVAVVTVNTDIPSSKRMCYIGTDYYRGGMIAAGLVSLLKPTGASIGVVHGSRKMFGHNERYRGFEELVIQKKCRIIDVIESEDDDIRAYELTKAMLERHTQIDTVFVVAAGVTGVCRAIDVSDRALTVITFDQVDATVELLKADKIKATISQQPREQVQKALDFIFEYLVAEKTPKKDCYYIQNQIKIKENYI